MILVDTHREDVATAASAVASTPADLP